MRIANGTNGLYWLLFAGSGCELIALDVNDPASVNAAVEVCFSVNTCFDPIQYIDTYAFP